MEGKCRGGLLSGGQVSGGQVSGGHLSGYEKLFEGRVFCGNFTSEMAPSTNCIYSIRPVINTYQMYFPCKPTYSRLLFQRIFRWVHEAVDSCRVGNGWRSKSRTAFNKDKIYQLKT